MGKALADEINPKAVTTHEAIDLAIAIDESIDETGRERWTGFLGN